MNKPYKYSVIENNNKSNISEYNSIESMPYFMRDEKKYTIYIDTRYEAKLRLFYYLHPEQKPKPYKPYTGTEIGISVPILNF